MKKIFLLIINFLDRIRKKYPHSHISIKSRYYSLNLEGYNRIGEGSNIENVCMGLGSYISNNGSIRNTKIGRYTSIGPNCQTIVFGTHPTSKFVSSHPAFYSKSPVVSNSFVKKDKYDEFKWIDKQNKISITIGNDVWIASNVTILEGVAIGDGAIIATGAVVTKDVPPYALVGGVPAKIIKYRFEDEDIDFLRKILWWNKSEEWIRNYAEYFEDIKKFKEVLR